MSRGERCTKHLRLSDGAPNGPGGSARRVADISERHFRKPNPESRPCVCRPLSTRGDCAEPKGQRTCRCNCLPRRNEPVLLPSCRARAQRAVRTSVQFANYSADPCAFADASSQNDAHANAPSYGRGDWLSLLRDASLPRSVSSKRPCPRGEPMQWRELLPERPCPSQSCAV